MKNRHIVDRSTSIKNRYPKDKTCKWKKQCGLGHIVSRNAKPDIVMTAGGGIISHSSNPKAITKNSTNWPYVKVTKASRDEQKGLALGDIDRDGKLDISPAWYRRHRCRVDKNQEMAPEHVWTTSGIPRGPARKMVVWVT